MPCLELVRNDKVYAFPQSPCREQCDATMGACKAELVEASNIIHSVPAMRMYGEEMWDTFCDLKVDMSCNAEPGAPYCFEQFHLTSQAMYVDVFQSQPGNPQEGHFLPDGTIIPCSTNDKEYANLAS